MSDVCESCGEQNAPHTAFCQSCGNYLGWEVEGADESSQTAHEHDDVARAHRATGGDGSTAAQRGDERRQSPSEPHGAAPVVTLDQQEWVLTPGGQPVVVPLHVANQSTIVDAYRAVVRDKPEWLRTDQAEVRLLPGTHEVMNVSLGIEDGVLVPPQRVDLVIRVESLAQASLFADVSMSFEVGVVKGEMGLQVEPKTVRAKDSTSAQFRVIVDNRHSNESLWASLKGKDPENAVRFTFSPPHLDVPAGRSMAARLHIEAALPDPGREHNRTLTIAATEGQRTVETSVTLVQTASADVIDPPMAMRLDPSAIRVENASTAATRVVVDNRRGSRSQRVSLSGYDDERAVAFSFSPATLLVPPGQTAAARVQLRAPRPGSGEEAIRPLTVSAWDGEQTVEAQGSFHQSSSDRRPLARVLLTLIGAALMIFGIFMPWSDQSTLGGDDWTYLIYAEALGFENVTDVTGFVPDMVVAGGIIVVLLSIMTVAGLIGTTGKMTRVAAVLCLLWIVAFVVVLSFTRFSSGPGTGAFVVGLGCVVAFIGGLLARR